MGIAGKILGFLLTLVYTPAAAAAAILFALQAQVYAAATYEDLFDRNAVFERVPGLIAHNYLLSRQAPALDMAKAQSVVKAMLPADILQATSAPVVSQLAAFARGESGEVAIDLTTLKETARQNVPAALAAAQEGLADCTAEQLQAGLAQSFACRPAAEYNDQLAEQARSMLNALLAETPETHVVPLESEAGPFNADQRRKLRLGMMFSPLLPIVLYLLIAAVAVRSWSAALLWFAIPTLIASLVVGAAGLVSQSLVPGFVKSKMEAGNGPAIDPADQLLSELTIDLAGSLSTGVTIAGGALAIAAVAALLATGAVRKAAAPPGNGYY